MSSLKEYNLEEEKGVDLTKLESGKMPLEDYIKAHQQMVVPCHDIFIQFDGGILLVTRDNEPMKGFLWPLGGRIQRGIETEESLKMKVKEEANLEIEKMTYIGSSRIYMHTEPFGHGKGTDNTVFVYFAVGKGNLRLDNLHKDPTIIKPENYEKIRETLHPYVRDFMDQAIKLVS